MKRFLYSLLLYLLYSTHTTLTLFTIYPLNESLIVHPSTLSITLSSFPDRFFLSLVVSTTFSSCSALYCYCIEELMMSSLIEMKTLLN